MTPTKDDTNVRVIEVSNSKRAKPFRIMTADSASVALKPSRLVHVELPTGNKRNISLNVSNLCLAAVKEVSTHETE